MRRTIATTAAALLLTATLTACNTGGSDDCDTQSLAPVAAVQAIPGRTSGGTSGGGRGGGSHTGSKPRPSVQKPAKPQKPPKHGSGHITGTTGGHSHHDHDCDDD